MRPRDVDAAMARAPIVWVPLGAIEYHASHLPLGTDSLTASHLVTSAAEALGGVVLPPSTLTLGTLHLPWSFRYEAALVEAALRSTIEQSAAFGARCVVIHTGHAPLDLLHLIKRVCLDAESQVRSADPVADGFRCYGLCYLELNAALGAGLDTDWPVAVDHGSITETSWMLAIDPTLVDLDTLPPESTGSIVGIYGPHPGGRASAELGSAQAGAAVRLLTQRVEGLLRGETIDPLADLRTLVKRYWTEDLELTVPDPTSLTLHNPGAVSRYLTSVRVNVDGAPLDPVGQRLSNPAPGEAGVPVAVDSLGTESGFYVRRGQSALLQLADPLPTGRHRLDRRGGPGGCGSRGAGHRVRVGLSCGER